MEECSQMWEEGEKQKALGLLPHKSQIKIMVVPIHLKLHSPVFGEAKTLLISKTGELVLIELDFFVLSPYSFVASIPLDHPT